MARNPKTGEEVQVPAKSVPFLKFSSKVKQRINESKTKEK